LIDYRNGCGELHNVKVDNESIISDNNKNYIEFKDEEPKIVAYKYIEDLTKRYEDYNKLSV